MRSIGGIHQENYEWLRPEHPCGAGVLVVAGSSGTVPVERASVLASCGLEAVALRWFGGAGQNVGPYKIELELFLHVLDEMAEVVDRVSIIGSSFGAEAALSVAAREKRLASVVAISPTTHVWPGRDPQGRMTSHWTWKNAPLPFVPLVDSWSPDDDPPSFRPWYELSLDVASDAALARITVEEIDGEVLLVAGGDDQVWPSGVWAREVAKRRTDSGRSTTVVIRPEAGHRPVLPGESVPSGGRRMNRGGTTAADIQLGKDAWPHIVDALGAHRTPKR